MKKTGLIKFIIFFFSIGFIFSTSSFAQDLEIDDLAELYGDEVVVTASKRVQKITDSPSAIAVITAEDIKMSGATQLAEALAMVPGLQIGFITHNSQLAGGIRGFNKSPANKIMLLLDGVPWDVEIYGIPPFNPFPLSLDDVERIEIVRGPGSSLYGANAVFGVINVITKKPKDSQETSMSVLAGELNTQVYTVQNGGPITDDLLYRLTLNWEQRDGFGDVAFLPDRVGEYLKFNSTIDYTIDDNSDLSLFITYMDVKRAFAVFEAGHRKTGAIRRYENVQ